MAARHHSSDESSDDDGGAPDARIAELSRFVASKAGSDKEFAELLDRLGSADAKVFGGLCFDKGLARAHFVVMALLIDGQPLPELIKERKGFFKASVDAGGEHAGKCLLAATESWVVNVCSGPSRAKNIKGFDKVLKAFWEWEVVSDEAVDEWLSDDKCSRFLQVKPQDAEAVRDAGRRFKEWMENDEE